MQRGMLLPFRVSSLKGIIAIAVQYLPKNPIVTLRRHKRDIRMFSCQELGMSDCIWQVAASEAPLCCGEVKTTENPHVNTTRVPAGVWKGC